MSISRLLLLIDLKGALCTVALMGGVTPFSGSIPSNGVPELGGVDGGRGSRPERMYARAPGEGDRPGANVDDGIGMIPLAGALGSLGFTSSPK